MSEYQRDIGRALAFLSEKPLLRAAALTAFDRGDADIIRQEEDGLLLRARSFPLVILCADSDRTALELLEALPACQLMQNERTATGDQHPLRLQLEDAGQQRRV